MVATVRDTVAMIARFNQTDDTLIASNTPWSYPRFTNRVASSGYGKLGAFTYGNVEPSPPLEVASIRPCTRTTASAHVDPVSVDVSVGPSIHTDIAPEVPLRSKIGNNMVASPTLLVEAERSNPNPNADIFDKIDALLSRLKSRRASIRKPGDPSVPLSGSSGAVPSPVEPSGVPGEGEASSESPYLAEVRCIFEKPLDGQRRKIPDSDTPIADLPCRSQVRKIFQRVIDEIDKPRDPLPKAEVYNAARCSTANGVDKPLGLAPKARVSRTFQRPTDKPRDQGPKTPVPSSDERKEAILRRARARVEQRRMEAGLRAPSKSSEDKKPFSTRVGLNIHVPQADANNPADIGTAAREPVQSDPTPQTTSSGSQCQSKPRNTLPCSSAHDRYARAMAIANRLSVLAEANASSYPYTVPEEAGRRAAHVSQLHDTFEAPAAQRPPVCAPSHQDAVAAKRNLLVDEVERMIMLARGDSETARSQQDSVGCLQYLYAD